MALAPDYPTNQTAHYLGFLQGLILVVMFSWLAIECARAEQQKQKHDAH